MKKENVTLKQLDQAEAQCAIGASIAIEEAYRDHQDFLIFALTGRTGSGCTTAADLLSREFDSSRTTIINPSIEEKKWEIVSRFSRKNWVKFKKVTVSSLILGILARDLKNNNGEIDNLAIGGEDAATLMSLYEENKELIDCLDCNGVDFEESKRTRASEAVKLFVEQLPSALVKFKSKVGTRYGEIMQTAGTNIRSSGCALHSNPNPDSLFNLPKAIVRVIEFIREDDKNKKIQTRIVVDAIRNPMELIYLRDRYSTLYAIAITSTEDDRQSRLISLGMDRHSIEDLDSREYPKKHDPLSSYQNAITQDIQSCLQKADIFITNNGKNSASESGKEIETAALYGQLIRYYALALHPGIVTPTRDERCMQTALVAKLNSGCISRQVGAAVTDENYVVRAIGWNDVPRGQVPCLLRNVDDLKNTNDEVTYSQYERTNDKLRDHVFKFYEKRKEKLSDRGLSCPYCFKDAANKSVFSSEQGNIKGSNQVHTRSLHAEENAFLQLTSSGSSGIKGGRLYTTASPCELCSKKAYQLGIADIVYIDPYPGISIPQIINAGNIANRPELRLFNGAVGKAYHRLYESMMPIKDEILARLQ